MQTWDAEWKPVPWDTARRARLVGIACRLDRHLEEAAAAATRAEARLAAALRQEVRQAVSANPGTEELFAKLSALHEQLAYLPRLPLPAGIAGLLRDLLGPDWDGDVVVAGVPELPWPPLVRVPVRPVAVIPLAEARNPLMWPLVALQGAAASGLSQRGEALDAALGAALAFARAEALFVADEPAARGWWRAGEQRLPRPGDGPGGNPWQLAAMLASGVLISGYRRGGRIDPEAPIYEQLAVVRDEPAQPADILTAGWIYWYNRTAAELVELAAGLRSQGEAEDRWTRMRALVDSLDDLLCRSLDVAAIHRFYAAEGAIR
ncbi:MAG TPA: hypothetical protein VIK98_11120 [Limnochordales bacterium]